MRRGYAQKPDTCGNKLTRLRDPVFCAKKLPLIFEFIGKFTFSDSEIYCFCQKRYIISTDFLKIVAGIETLVDQFLVFSFSTSFLTLFLLTFIN